MLSPFEILVREGERMGVGSGFWSRGFTERRGSALSCGENAPARLGVRKNNGDQEQGMGCS